MRRTSKSVIAGILVSLATAAVSGAAKAAGCVSNTLDKYTAPGFYLYDWGHDVRRF
jgi:hypothetical protein